MFRDRTNLFLSYRRTYPHHSVARLDSVEEEALIGSKSIELVSLPPSFLDLGEEVDDLVAEITGLTEKLNALYKRNLLPGFNDRSIDEEEIQKLNYTITSKFLKCQNLVRKFDGLKHDSRLKADDLNLIDNMQKNYALTVQQVSSNFRKLQNNYIKFLKKDEFEQTPKFKNTYNPAIDDETEELESYSREAIKESSSILQQSTNINDSIIRQREQEITKLAQGVLEVSSIFKEMHSMVIEQGTVLDRIDYNIENTKVDLKQADQELNRASHYQKRTQKCKLILLLTLVVLLLFAIVVTKPYRHVGVGHSGKASSPKAGDETDVQEDQDRTAIQHAPEDEPGTLDEVSIDFL